MNEEIEYAEMLEIPVSTVNVVKKKRAKKRKVEPKRPESKSAPTDLKESVIAHVNDKVFDEPTQAERITAEAELFAESANSAGEVCFDDIPDRIDTVRLFAEGETPFGESDTRLHPQDYAFLEDGENEGGRYAPSEENGRDRGWRIALNAEFALACALCGAIFLTNVFVPNSAINTFFRSLAETEKVAVDTRGYADFTLSPIVSELSDAELTLSPTGILTFTDACCVYPAADGKVAEITKNADESYTVKIAHSQSFTGVFEGLDSVYFAVGEEVKANIPVGYSAGEKEVQVTMYSDGALLDCFTLTEENCLAWIAQE
ncbi:MAG: hypothetical protein IJB34_02415 [Clostridia bacterium]|nr:hypothetical protein [Clostridia bacterium]